MSGVNFEEKPQLGLVPSAADLDAWSGDAWTSGIQIDGLKELDRFLVETLHHTYDITVIDPRTAEVLICGGDVFPATRPVHISGATLGMSFIKSRGVYVGFRMEILADGKRIVTSPVQRIRLNP